MSSSPTLFNNNPLTSWDWLAKDKVMWLAILIIGTIIGGVIGYFYRTDNYYNGIVDMMLCAALFFAICFCLKMSFDDKTFICTDVTIGVVKRSNFGFLQKKLEKSKPSILGSKMVLEFFDNSVKCTFTYLRKNQELTEVHVLDEVDEGHIRSPYDLDDRRPETPHTFQSESARMELDEIMWFVTSFTISVTDANNDIVVMTYKRKYF